MGGLNVGGLDLLLINDSIVFFSDDQHFLPKQTNNNYTVIIIVDTDSGCNDLKVKLTANCC